MQLHVSSKATTEQAPHPAGDLLIHLRVDHGPPGLLGRFFLAAEQAARQRGVYLEFGSFDEFGETNRRNLATWSQLNRAFDSSIAPIPPYRAFCILGRDRRGEVVATQAARL